MIASRTIALTRGFETIVDADDYERLMEMASYGWRAVGKDDRYIYAKATIGESFVAMHRVITDAAPGLSVDHINRNTLDNRKENLRIVSSQENIWRGVHKRLPKSSGYRGVRGLGGGRFVAYTRIAKKVYYGPTRSDVIAAAHDYDALVRELKGEFCVLNFPYSTSETTAGDALQLPAVASLRSSRKRTTFLTAAPSSIQLVSA